MRNYIRTIMYFLKAFVFTVVVAGALAFLPPNPYDRLAKFKKFSDLKWPTTKAKKTVPLGPTMVTSSQALFKPYLARAGIKVCSEKSIKPHIMKVTAKLAEYANLNFVHVSGPECSLHVAYEENMEPPRVGYYEYPSIIRISNRLTYANFYRVVFHEFLHALGLFHSDSPTTIMYESTRSRKAQLIYLQDVATLRSIWGPPKKPVGINNETIVDKGEDGDDNEEEEEGEEERIDSDQENESNVDLSGDLYVNDFFANFFRSFDKPVERIDGQDIDKKMQRAKYESLQMTQEIRIAQIILILIALFTLLVLICIFCALNRKKTHVPLRTTEP